MVTKVIAAISLSISTLFLPVNLLGNSSGQQIERSWEEGQTPEINETDESVRIDVNRLVTNSPESIPNFDYMATRHVTCGTADGRRTTVATITHVGPKTYISAAHVFDGKAWCIDTLTKERLDLVWSYNQFDFAVAYSKKDLDDTYLPIDCNGFQKGQEYYSIGWAYGTILVKSKMIATGDVTNNDFKVYTNGLLVSRPGFHKLEGYLFNGMSGGPIVNSQGAITGMNNATNIQDVKAYSWQLKDTYLCN